MLREQIKIPLRATPTHFMSIYEANKTKPKDIA